MSATSIHEIRLGRVRALIWREESAEGARHWVTVGRTTSSGPRTRPPGAFEPEDLPVVAEIMDLAHLWICEQAELIA